MKKLSKISLAIIAPTVTAVSLIPLTSCSAFWNYIDPEIRFGEYVYGATHTNILLYDSFTIKLTNSAKGYEQFDTSKTIVNIDGVNVKYRLVDPTTILVPAELVTSTNIKLYLEAKETCQDVRVSWSDAAASRFDIVASNAQCHVKDALGEADTIYYSDLKVEALWGDPDKNDWRPINISDTGFDIFYYDYSKRAYDKITDSFKKQGRTFTENDFRENESGQKLRTQFKFAFRYRTNTFEKQLLNFDGVYGEVCYHTKSISITNKPAGDKMTVNSSHDLWATVEPELAPRWFEFEMLSDGGTGSYFESGSSTLVAGNKAGDVYIHVKALEKEGKSSDIYKITIVAA